MSHQFTRADGAFNGKRRKTRKEIFFARMDDDAGGHRACLFQGR